MAELPLCFHLGETGKHHEGKPPFAFLATVITGTGENGKAQHRALSRVLAEGHAGAAVLLALLTKLGEKELFWRQLHSRSPVWKPQYLSGEQAYRLLATSDTLAGLGIKLKLPAAWQGRKPAKMRLNITVQAGTGSAEGGKQPWLRFRPRVLRPDGKVIKDIEELPAKDGLIRLAGKWVMVSRQRLAELTDHWQQLIAMQRQGVPLTTALSWLARWSASRDTEALGLEQHDDEDPGQRDVTVELGPALLPILRPLLNPSEAALSPADQAVLAAQFKATLRPYQQAGVAWLNQLLRCELGGVLADDMGLGKTVQVLALLTILRRRPGFYGSGSSGSGSGPGPGGAGSNSAASLGGSGSNSAASLGGSGIGPGGAGSGIADPGGDGGAGPGGDGPSGTSSAAGSGSGSFGTSSAARAVGPGSGSPGPGSSNSAASPDSAGSSSATGPDYSRASSAAGSSSAAGPGSSGSGSFGTSSAARVVGSGSGNSNSAASLGGAGIGPGGAGPGPGGAGARGPCLLIVPTSLLGNWQREAAKFAPGLRLVTRHASAGESCNEDWRDADIVLTSYGMVKNRPEFSEICWQVVVCDEAQALKNPATAVHQAVQRLPGGPRLLLTGTPIENSLSDLWALMDICCRPLLGTWPQFRDRLAELAANPAPVKTLIKPFLLRRMKTDPKITAELPPKIYRDVYCPLSERQTALYQEELSHFQAHSASQQGPSQQGPSQQGPSPEGPSSEGQQPGRGGHILTTLLHLRQICNHPAQLLKDDQYLVADSGKFYRLGELARKIKAQGERLLVFTAYRELTAELAALLARVFGREGFVLHGGTAPAERSRMVAEFQRPDGPPFFVLSLKAGGTGLTLTAASHVVHFDRWWNPAIENQATDRAYRIGQTKRVIVHRFICPGTVEERLGSLVAAKQHLADDVIDGLKGLALDALSDDELLAAFRLTTAATELS